MYTEKELLFQSRLILAEILYYMPDHPSLLQTFVWQKEDVPPIYPRLKHFIQFWNDKLDADIHMVRIDSKKLYEPTEFINAAYDGYHS